MHKPDDQELADALRKCESEPIHLAHSIQPHGFLLAIDERGEVCLASSNLSRLTGTAPEAALGLPLARVVGETAGHAILQAADALCPGQSTTLRLDGLRQNTATTAHGRIHRADGLRVVELELEQESEAENLSLPGAPDNETAEPTGSSLIRETLRQLDQEDEVIACCRMVAGQIRQLTGFDRVMIYRFSENWDGEVISESHNDRLPAMLGHHFPASDIPPQARALYARNQIRVLCDTEARPTPLLPASLPLTGQRLDMSDCALRSMSPIHIRYLRNMGVSASLSVSLMQGGRLWGLIACHHTSARLVPFPVREVAEIIGRMTSFKLDSLENRRSQSWLARLHDTQLRLTDVIRSAQSVACLNEALESNLLPLIDASACLLVVDQQRFAVGALPPADALTAFVQWLRASHPTECVFSTDCLARHFPPAEAFASVAAGAIAIALDVGWKHYLICVRPEIVRDIVWAGNPAKQISHDETGAHLDPRHSFSSWVETARGRSLPWDRYSIDALTTVSQSLLMVIAEKSVQALAQRINRVKDEFVANISHEMRTPLHAILSFAGIALQRLDSAPDKLAGYLTRIQASGQRLHALVEDLLILTRLRAGMVTVDSHQTNLRSILGTCLEKFSPLAEQKGLQVATHLRTERFDACVSPDLIGKMIDKLLSNAGKFSPAAGHITTILSDGSVAGDDGLIDAICIEILDEGHGIPADELESVFDKFSQSTRTQTGAGGTGLGLSICREIMALHGGSIRAENRVTGGTRLVCLIPRVARSALSTAR